MQLLTIINEVLRKRRERPIASIAANPYGALILDYITEVCRELANSGIDGAATLNVALQPVLGVVSITGVPKDAFLRVQEVYDWKGQKLEAVSSPKLRTLRQDEIYSGRAYQLAGTVPEVWGNHSENGGTGTIGPQIAVFPMPVEAAAQGRVNVVTQVNPMRMATPTETTDLNFPAHLVILGTFWKVLQEVYGEDNVDTQAAKATYMSAVSNEVAVDLQLDGSGVDSWNPV
jgi:hypothetical protein